MNNKVNALDKLIEAVEAGTAHAAHFACCFEPGANSPYWSAGLAYNGSLDAALALHEALLPGWRWDLDASSTAGVWNTSDTLPAITGHSPTPARAWLLAILRAYRSMQS